MIGILVANEESKRLYLKDREERRFIAVKECTRTNHLPEGCYVVKLVEYRRGKHGLFPVVSLVKPLPSLQAKDVALALSETSLTTQKEALQLLWKIGLSETQIERVKNLLNCIAIADKGEVLWEEEPREDPYLKELGIHIGKVRRKYHAILNAKQEGSGQDL
ncbi:MAG: hypothetical protein N3C13_03870 [Aquificaceae bacterium]|nr:hypothetical protein [Aquificaceae bacterium]